MPLKFDELVADCAQGGGGGGEDDWQVRLALGEKPIPIEPYSFPLINNAAVPDSV